MHEYALMQFSDEGNSAFLALVVFVLGMDEPVYYRAVSSFTRSKISTSTCLRNSFKFPRLPVYIILLLGHQK